MPLRVYNTRSRSLETFETLKPRLARMYVCGPTVYERAHVGHARSYVFYDVVRRVLLAEGYEVEHVQNFTDIEESVAKKAKEAGVAPLALADRMIHLYLGDMDALRILRADHYPRVSDNIEEIQRIVHDLCETGAAYRVDCHPGADDGEDAEVCDVYFDVTTRPDFGELVGASPDDLIVDQPPESGDRRHPLDFALWKSHDDWGVTWPSPWGDGRPGWHVECAAMSLKYLGPHFDLHGGGLDLVFPHHESERAIAEAWTKDTFATYFVHNGFVTVGQRKMSKSKGNYVTLEDLLGAHDAEALRVFLLSVHYRAPLDYDPTALKAAAKRLAGWKKAAAALAKAAGGAAPAREPAAAVVEAREALWAALRDDFRTDLALEAVDRLAASAGTLREGDAAAALAALREAADALGVLWELESRWAPSPLPTMPAR